MNTLKTKFPCCSSRKATLPFAHPLGATEVVKRKCPSCGQRWQVIVRPAKNIKQGIYNVIEWTPCANMAVQKVFPS